MRIHTHKHYDLDNGATLAMLRVYSPTFAAAKVIGHPADWTGAGVRIGDVCIDIEPDYVPEGVQVLKGRRDEDGTTHSAFQYALEALVDDPEPKYLFRRTLDPLIDAIDRSGDGYWALYPQLDLQTRQLLNDTGLPQFYRGLRTGAKSDKEFLGFMELFIEGHALDMGRQDLGQPVKVMRHVLDLNHATGIEAYCLLNDIDPGDAKVVTNSRGHWNGRLKINGKTVVLMEDPFDTGADCLLVTVLKQYGTDEDRELLRPMVRLINAYRRNRNPYKVMLRNTEFRDDVDMIGFLGNTSLTSGVDGLRYKADAEIEQTPKRERSGVIQYWNRKMRQFARALYEGLRKNQLCAKQVTELVETDDPRLHWSKNRQIVLFDRAEINNHRMRDILGNYHGVRAVVVVDANNLVMIRVDGEKLRLDKTPDGRDTPMIELLRQHGELCQSTTAKPWFVHPAGWLIGWGTRKAPKSLGSSVDPFALLELLNDYFDEHPKAQLLAA